MGEEQECVLLGQGLGTQGFFEVGTSQVFTCPKSCLYPATTLNNSTKDMALPHHTVLLRMLPYRYSGNEDSILIPGLALSFEPRYSILPGQ